MPSHSQRAKVHLDDEATKDDLPTCVKVFSIATIEGFKGSDSLGSPKESCKSKNGLICRVKYYIKRECRMH